MVAYYSPIGEVISYRQARRYKASDYVIRQIAVAGFPTITLHRIAMNVLEDNPEQFSTEILFHTGANAGEKIQKNYASYSDAETDYYNLLMTHYNGIGDCEVSENPYLGWDISVPNNEGVVFVHLDVRNEELWRENADDDCVSRRIVRGGDIFKPKKKELSEEEEMDLILASECFVAASF